MFCLECPSTVHLNSHPGLVEGTTLETLKPVHSLKEDLKYEKETKQKIKGNWGKKKKLPSRKRNESLFYAKEWKPHVWPMPAH